MLWKELKKRSSGWGRVDFYPIEKMCMKRRLKIGLTSILYKADPDTHLQKKADRGWPLEKADPIPKFTVWVKDSFLTDSRVLISNMTTVF